MTNFSSHNIVYAESTVNFNWTNIMKMINEDPLSFYENGGWNSLQINRNHEDDDSEEESEFELTTDSTESAEDEDDSYNSESSESKDDESILDEGSSSS